MIARRGLLVSRVAPPPRPMRGWCTRRRQWVRTSAPSGGRWRGI